MRYSASVNADSVLSRYRLSIMSAREPNSQQTSRANLPQEGIALASLLQKSTLFIQVKKVWH